LHNTNDFQKAHEAQENLNSIEFPNKSELPFELLHGRHRKTTKLVANSGSLQSIKGAHRWYEFVFEEPVFLLEIIVNEENYSTYNEFEFKWTDVGGADETQKLSKGSDGQYVAPINQLVRQVSFRPPQRWRSDTKISRVKLVGFQKDELADFVRLIAQVESYKASAKSEVQSVLDQADAANQEILNAQSRLETLAENNKAATARIEELNANIGRLTEERKSLVEDIGKREEAIGALDDRRSKIQDTISERTSVREGLASEIAEQKQKLRSLEDNVNMFPTELGAFVSQGGQNIKTYWKLAYVPIFLLVIITGLLVFNAANLTTVFDEVEGANIWSILVTRMPFVFIATAIITASYKLARVLILEIMRINQQRLSLSKISIVATDVSNSSQEGLADLDDREIYELRTDLKMQLLRDHLKEYLSGDFEYQGKSSSGLAGLLKKNTQKNNTEVKSEEVESE